MVYVANYWKCVLLNFVTCFPHCLHGPWEMALFQVYAKLPWSALFPKNNSPSDLSDYEPITSVVMICFEKIVLHHLLDLTNGMQDPFQFAY